MKFRRLTVLLMTCLVAVRAPAAREQTAPSLLRSFSEGGRAAKMEDIFMAGRAALADGLLDIARKQFEAYLRQAVEADDPERAAEAVKLLGRTLHGQGKTEQILDFLSVNQRWLQKAKDSGIAPFWRALARHEMGDLAGAMEDLAGFEEMHPESVYVRQASRLRAWCYLKLGQIDEALVAFARHDQRFGEEEGGQLNRLEWGKALIARGRPVEAAEVLEKLGLGPPESEVVQEGAHWLGQLMVATQNWERAAAVLGALAQNAAAADDLRAKAWFLMATVHVGQDHPQEAVGALNRGIERARSLALKLEGRCDLGLLLLKSGNLEEGVALLKAFISEAPQHPKAEDAQLKLAGALLDRSDAERAVAEFQYYLETFTNVTGQARAQRGRGWGLMSVGRHAEAATAFSKAFDLFSDPGDKAQTLFKVGDAYFANKQYKLAADTYERLLTENPRASLAAEALFQLGESRARGGDSQGAEQVFLSLVDKHPGAMAAQEALIRIAEIREEQEHWVDAVDAYERLMNGYTNSAFYADALLGRGLVRYRLFRFQEAVRDFSLIISRFPESDAAEDALHKVALSYYWLGQDDRALELTREFLEKHPESIQAPRALFWMGKYQYNQKQFAEAQKSFLDFVDKYPNDADAENALLWAGRASAMRSEYLGANVILTRMIKEYPLSKRIPDARFVQGDALCQLAKFAEAILIFQEIINKFPSSELLPETWLRTGDCRFMLGAETPERYEEAVHAFQLVADNPAADPDLVLEAQYKIGRCMEKQGRLDEAVEQYYTGVMVPFLKDRDAGLWHTESAKTWFWRASRDAASILESRQEWRKVIHVLDRVIGTGIPDEPEIREKIKQIRSEHWLLFY